MSQPPETPSASAATAKPCPICGKARDSKFKPFCSRRCADIDLHRWLSGQYAVPAVENEDDAEDEPGGTPERG